MSIIVKKSKSEKKRRATDNLDRRKSDSSTVSGLEEAMVIIKDLKKDIKSIVKKKRHWSKKTNLWMLNFKSSNLKKVGYDLRTKTLYIMFSNNSEYKYTDVNLEWWVALTLAKSKGTYFAEAKYKLENVEKL